MKYPTQYKKCDFHDKLIPELQFFRMLILIPILGWFQFWFWFQGLPKINVSDSNSDSSSKWSRFWFRFQCFRNDLLRFWFRFQHNLTPIPIPTNQALIPILIPESDSNSGIIYNSAKWRPAHRAQCFATGLFWLSVKREKDCLSQNLCGICDIHT